MSNWPNAQLATLLRETDGLSYGIVQPGKPRTDGVPIIRVTDLAGGRVDTTSPLKVAPEIEQSHRRSRLAGGEVLLSIVGTVGRVAVVPPALSGWNVARAVAVLRARDGDTANWIHYALQSPIVQAAMGVAQTDTVQATLNLRDIRELVIPFPPLGERQRIAGVLGALDDLIEANRILISDSAELISSLFNQLMTASALTEMPLFEAFDVDFGGAFKGDKFSPMGVGMPLLRIRDLKTQKSDTWTTERINGDVVVSAGDVLVGMDAEFRPTFWLGPDSLLNQRVCRIRPRVGSLAFAREALVKPMRFIEGHKTGTTVSHLNKADLAETWISIPDDRSLAKFDAMAEPLRLAIVGLHRENLELSLARDELLPLLMSGRVRVGDVAA